MRLPKLLKAIIDPDSRKVALGWQVFIWATYGTFFAKNGSSPLMEASTWLLAVTAATALIGGGTVLDNKHKLEMTKLNPAQNDPPTPEK